MPILVTGGTGFLGVNLVRLLVGRGQRVRLLVRATSSRLGLESPLIEFVGGDVTDVDSIRRAMAGCDRVFHLAAWVQISPWGWKVARRTNVEGTRNICSVALDTGVTRLVHTSSIATMAAGTLVDPADENTKWNIDAGHVPYYRTKLDSEQVVLEHVDRGLSAVIVNPTYLVGPWDVKPGAGRILILAAKGRLCFYPRAGGINYADVRSAAVGHLQAMERGKDGERYILGGENLSFKAYLRRAAVFAGVRPPRLALPYFVMYPFAAAGSLLGRIFPSLFRDVNLAILHSASLEHFVSSDKAHRELGFEVTPIDPAIEDAIRWFIDHGYLKGCTVSPCADLPRGQRCQGPSEQQVVSRNHL